MKNLQALLLLQFIVGTAQGIEKVPENKLDQTPFSQKYPNSTYGLTSLDPCWDPDQVDLYAKEYCEVYPNFSLHDIPNDSKEWFWPSTLLSKPQRPIQNPGTRAWGEQCGVQTNSLIRTFCMLENGHRMCDGSSMFNSERHEPERLIKDFMRILDLCINPVTRARGQQTPAVAKRIEAIVTSPKPLGALEEMYRLHTQGRIY
jgi:hypothetical protein